MDMADRTPCWRVPRPRTINLNSHLSAQRVKRFAFLYTFSALTLSIHQHMRHPNTAETCSHEDPVTVRQHKRRPTEYTKTYLIAELVRHSNRAVRSGRISQQLGGGAAMSRTGRGAASAIDAGHD